MDNLYKKYFEGLYLKTGGFISTKPINQSVYPGDFFQISNGEMIVLGNIYRKSIINPEEKSIEYGLKLNPANWSFNDGVTNSYFGRGTRNNPIEGEFEYSKQILEFKTSGSFFFRGNNPESVKISNWNEIKDVLIIKLTQTFFSFREVYVVTECATNSDWTLAIASSHKAEIEIATDKENFGLVDIFGHSSAKVIQSKDIEYYHHEPNRIPSFFRAKKLVVNDEKQEAFIRELISERKGFNEWARSFFDFDSDNYTQPISINAHISVLDMLQGNQLNPNTALQYFKWKDANLDDVEKLFMVYGNYKND
jgi:hypothetical protein